MKLSFTGSSRLSAAHRYVPKHLDYYLDEFTFRFNRRTAHARGLLFHRLAEQAIVTPPVTYRGIVTGEGPAAVQNLLE